jgi:hypothetical protein
VHKVKGIRDAENKAASDALKNAYDKNKAYQLERLSKEELEKAVKLKLISDPLSNHDDE